jgi:hypothetical protein
MNSCTGPLKPSHAPPARNSFTGSSLCNPPPTVRASEFYHNHLTGGLNNVALVDVVRDDSRNIIMPLL